MSECNVADATHFMSMGADEKSYNKDDKTVEYNVILTRLNINGRPCNLLEWFQELWRICKEVTEGEAVVNFVLTTLNIPSLIYVHMIWCTTDDDSLPALEITPVIDNATLVAHLKKYVLCERSKHFNANSIYIRSTGEFDNEYAFFKPAAIANNELGEHLSKYVKISDETGEVEALLSRVRCSAYL